MLNSRIAVYGPVRTVVWEGREPRGSPPIPISPGIYPWVSEATSLYPSVPSNHLTLPLPPPIPGLIDQLPRAHHMLPRRGEAGAAVMGRAGFGIGGPSAQRTLRRPGIGLAVSRTEIL